MPLFFLLADPDPAVLGEHDQTNRFGTLTFQVDTIPSGKSWICL